MGFAILVIHWLLLFVWGIGLNDIGGGYLYCRMAMPGQLSHGLTPWIFTATLCILLSWTGSVEHRRGRSVWMAYLPVLLFILTQSFALWLHLNSIRR